MTIQHYGCHISAIQIAHILARFMAPKLMEVNGEKLLFPGIFNNVAIC